MAPIILPYHVATEELPSPLPTLQEIESSQEVLIEYPGRKVVGVGEHFVVKYGTLVQLIEGENMLFVARTTSIPVPRVYVLFTDASSKQNYIIMERVVGQGLDALWTTLNDQQKDTITTKLRILFKQLRGLAGSGKYCSIDERPLLDGVFWTEGVTQPLAGPFDSETELNQAMVKKYCASGYLPVQKAKYYERSFPSVLRDHPPVFTHGDLHLKNIMVRQVPRASEGEEQSESVKEFDLVLIDWEFAGCYPSYWEFARAIHSCGEWRDDWSIHVERILTPYRNEWAWMNMLLEELWS